MKYHKPIWIVAILILMSIVGAFAQDKPKAMPKEGMKMSEMSKSPHHVVAMAFKQNALTFTKALRDMASSGKIEDAGLARNAFAEIKRSMEKMEEIHQAHMSKMSAEMREQMKSMMKKMQAEKAAMSDHIVALEKVLQADSPNPQEVEKHAAALVSQFEKIGMPEKKMAMPAKSKT